MEPISVRDVKADGNARIHVGNSSITHVHNYAEPQECIESPPAPFSLIPFSQDPDFVSRGDILGQIAAQCTQPGGRAALVGLGGVGKSQLAIEYAYQFRDKGNGTWIFWVHGGTRGRVEEGFRAIADAVKLPGRHASKADIPQLLQAWLSNEKNGKWLIIIDSADDHDVFYSAEPGSNKESFASYLPQSPNGSVLVTTRDHGFAFRLTGNYQSVIKVGPMEPVEAVLLLEKKLGVAAQTELAAELVNSLDCIPLAINQAASYIQARSPRCTIEKYLCEFRESERKSAKLLAHDSAELRRDGSASNAIMKTWQISFDHIRSKQPSAADLLSLMSFFDYQSIPESALNPEDDYDSDFDSDLESNGDADELANEFSTLHIIAAKNRRNKTPSTSDFDSDSDSENDNFEDDISTLRNFCLISVNEAGTEFEMHRLVQLATKKWLAATKRHERFKQLFIHRVCMSMPSATPHEFIYFRDFVVHMQVAASYRPNKANTRAWCSICYRLSWLRYYTGQSNEAREPLEKAYAAWKERKGAEHKTCLTYRRLLGDILLDSDQVSDSESTITDVLEIQKRTLGHDNESTLATMISLAEIYVRQGRYAEAETLESQATEAAKRTIGPENVTTLTYMACLSRTLIKQNRLEEAEETDLAALNISKRVFGSTHFETLELMISLAETYQYQSRYDEALKLELEVLKFAKSAPRPDNLMIANSMARVAALYGGKGMFVEAEEMGKAAVDLLTAEFGPTHPSTLYKLTDLAVNYQEQGRKEEANTILLDALARARVEHGPDHAYTIACMEPAVFIFEQLGQYDEAAELQAHILTYRRRTQGNTHVDTIGGMTSLAGLFERQEKFQEAVTLYEEALSLLEAKFGFKHEDTLRTAGRTASLYTDQMGRPSEAVVILERECQANQTMHGAEHKVTVLSMLKLSEAQRLSGFLEDAEKLQRQVWAIRKPTLGPHHRKTLSAMYSLADTLEDSGQFEEAIELMREVLAGYKALGLETLAPMAAVALGRVCLYNGNFDDALQAFSESASLCEANEGVDCPEALDCLAWKGTVYSEQDRWSEAVEVFSHLLELRKSVLGPDDRDTVMTMRRLAICLSHADEYDKSIVVLSECVDRMRQLFGAEDPDTVNVEQLLADGLEDDDDDDENAPDSSTLEDDQKLVGEGVSEVISEESRSETSNMDATQ